MILCVILNAMQISPLFSFSDHLPCRVTSKGKYQHRLQWCHRPVAKRWVCYLLLVPSLFFSFPLGFWTRILYYNLGWSWTCHNPCLTLPSIGVLDMSYHVFLSRPPHSFQFFLTLPFLWNFLLSYSISVAIAKHPRLGDFFKRTELYSV